jgi:glycosyltransferase involved in cell wall biosynthesis
MKIGFDAKRAFHNKTGLGNYSRGLIKALASTFPQHHYFLFNTKASNLFDYQSVHVHEVLPENRFYKKFKWLWRSLGVIKDLKKNKIDIFHGLSHEIPFGLKRNNIKSVVTIHDLITFRFPNQFSKVDAFIHQKKIKYACENADHIIAISHQTKDDIIEFLKIDANKISVCYQHCDAKFSIKKSTEEKNKIKAAYELPDQYFLYVGSIIERKNLMQICEAIRINNGKCNIPLVVIGKGSSYKEKVKAFIKEHHLEEKIIFLSDKSILKNDAVFNSGSTFPEIYQSALAFIYPSSFEGFGIPIIEALWSGTPVITSNQSCLPEAAGPDSILIDPNNINELARAMLKVSEDESLRIKMATSGYEYVKKFSEKNSAESVMKIYQSLL